MLHKQGYMNGEVTREKRVNKVESDVYQNSVITVLEDEIDMCLGL